MVPLQTGAAGRYDEGAQVSIELPRRKPGFSFLRTNCNEAESSLLSGLNG